MNSVARRLQAAEGYLELGLPLEAHAELESLDPDERQTTEVLGLRLAIFQALGQWEPMAVVASQLCKKRPGDAQWAISLAYATRRASSLERALNVLTHAVARFSREPIIHYNLACYEAQLRRLDLARAHLKRAIELAPACREMALRDEDLTPLHEELQRAGKPLL